MPGAIIDSVPDLKGFLPIRATSFVFALAAVTGCHSMPPGKPLSELTPRELAGRQVFLLNCARCHYADSEEGLHGPGLEGLFRQPYLPSGGAATDERVTDVILHGRAMMKPFGDRLTEQQLSALLAYLHTL